MAKIAGGMRQRLDGIIGFVRGYGTASDLETEPGPDGKPGCSPRLMLGVVVALAVVIALYVTGRIAYDFTLTPAERAAADAVASSTDDSQSPGEPYLDGRHYAITGTGDEGANRVYTFELLGDGDSGDIRVWEDETGRGTFTITGGFIRIEMERMVPAEAHAGWEPNVFEGTLNTDGSRIDGTWTRRSWTALDGTLELGDWEDYRFYAERL